MNSYEILEDQDIKVKPAIVCHFLQLLSGVCRKINKKPKLTNPWKVKSVTNLYPAVFLKWYKAVRDFHVKTYRSIEVKKSRKGEVKEIIISFTHIGPLCYHLGRAINVKTKDTFLKKYLRRTWSDGCRGDLVVCEETPATLTFNMKSGKLSFLANYEVRNRYGNVCL